MSGWPGLGQGGDGDLRWAGVPAVGKTGVHQCALAVGADHAPTVEPVRRGSAGDAVAPAERVDMDGRVSLEEDDVARVRASCREVLDALEAKTGHLSRR